jgi:hypothetical protein
MKETTRTVAGETWVRHETSSGVTIETYDDGEVTIRSTHGRTLLLSPTQWRELATFAITQFESCTTCEAAPPAAT